MINVHVTPKAPRDEIGGFMTDSDNKQWLKVKVTAAPEDGKATKAVLKLLAKSWKIPFSQLTVVSGETSRYKRIRYCPKG